MSNSATVDRPTPPAAAYPYEARLADMKKFIAAMAKLGPDALERTISRLVGPTYGISVEEVKAEKAHHRNELSFGEGK